MYHRLYVEFIYYFNIERDYFECHEVMEEYWMMEGRNKLLQALLQVAVGLHHFRNSNRNGAVKLFEQSLEKSITPWHGKLGIDKDKLFFETQQYLEKLNDYEQHPFSFYDLNITITDPVLEALVAACVPEGVPEEDKF